MSNTEAETYYSKPPNDRSSLPSFAFFRIFVNLAILLLRIRYPPVFVAHTTSDNLLASREKASHY